MHFGQVEPDELDDNSLVFVINLFSFPFFFPKIVYSRYVHADFSRLLPQSQLTCIHPSIHQDTGISSLKSESDLVNEYASHPHSTTVHEAAAAATSNGHKKFQATHQ